MEKESKKDIIKKALLKYKENPGLYSLTKLSKEFKVKRQTLSKYLIKEDYKIVNYQNLVKVDETLFDEIDTEEKAYWLGFMFADGNISATDFRVTLNLSIKDESHLLKFKEFLKYTGNISYTHGEHPGCRIFFRSKRMWNSLNNLGCTPAKSLTLNFPEQSVFKYPYLIKHFIRGYCDGDGFLGCYLRNDKHFCEIGFVGTESFLKSILDFLQIKGYIRNKTSKNWPNKAYNLSYAANKARKVARILYENSTIYLDRKYKIFQQYCQLEKEFSSFKSSKIEES